MAIEIINYETQGTCCKQMNIEIEDEIIKNVEFIGGCPGNLLGIRNLVIGMKINDVILKFKGILCGSKPTSCPDQLARCLDRYLVQKSKASTYQSM